MIVLANDIEGRAFERAPVAGEHQLVDVVFILVDALIVIADVAEDIRRRADLAAVTVPLKIARIGWPGRVISWTMVSQFGPNITEMPRASFFKKLSISSRFMSKSSVPQHAGFHFVCFVF